MLVRCGVPSSAGHLVCSPPRPRRRTVQLSPKPSSKAGTPSPAGHALPRRWDNDARAGWHHIAKDVLYGPAYLSCDHWRIDASEQALASVGKDIDAAAAATEICRKQPEGAKRGPGRNHEQPLDQRVPDQWMGIPPDRVLRVLVRHRCQFQPLLIKGGHGKFGSLAFERAGAIINGCNDGDEQ